MTETMGLVLTGTVEELASVRAKKVIVAASFASVLVSQETVEAEDLKRLSPFAKSLVLTYKEQHVTTSNSMMRAVASLAPASGLLGTCDLEEAQIDGWLSFLWTSIDLPSYILAGGENIQIQKDLDEALAKLDGHLRDKRFMVGDAVSLADISLAISLEKVKPNEGSNLSRWFDSISAQLY